MVQSDRFLLHEVRKQTILQPECPVYIHCSRLCTEKESKANFLQIRMVNRSDRLISSVFLKLEGLAGDGSVLFEIPELVLGDCNALPHSVFGENRLIALGRKMPGDIRITVERAVFADGMIWRRLPGQKLTSLQEAGWTPCTCGMLNPPDAAVCALCGAELAAKGQKISRPQNREEQRIPLSACNRKAERPGPIVRKFIPQQFPEEEEQGPSRGLVILLVVLALLAVLAAAGFIYWCIVRGII